jgi:cardiolipin synthase
MNFRELTQLPNLLSFVRIPLGIAVLPLLANDRMESAWLAVGLIVLAGISDGLDGYAARRLNKITELGIAFDPICDKIFAFVLVLGLILYRGFPIWLAGAVVARDLIILAGGLYLSRTVRSSLPSNLPGKYAFAALTVLIGSYVVRFIFGVTLLNWIVAVLLAVSLVSYSRVFFHILKQGQLPEIKYGTWGRWGRLVLICLFAVVYLYRLYTDILVKL